MWGLFIRFGAWLGGMLLSLVPSLVGQVLVSLGIGFVTYKGVDVALGFAKSMAVSNLAALPPQVVGILSLMKVGVCISMVASAIAVRLGINGMNSGAIKRWVKQ